MLRPKGDETVAINESELKLLENYIGTCACPGMACFEACRTCDQTQGLVNEVRDLLR